MGNLAGAAPRRARAVAARLSRPFPSATNRNNNSAREVEFIRGLISDNPDLSRRALSAKLCAAWNRRQANGALRDMVCRGPMLQLHRAGIG